MASRICRHGQSLVVIVFMPITMLANMVSMIIGAGMPIVEAGKCQP
jgi:hypothetical protein